MLNRSSDNLPLNVDSKLYYEGGFGIFGFADLANFWFGLLVFANKNCGFSVLVSCTVFRVFSNLIFGFRFLSTIMAVFRIFLSNAFYGVWFLVSGFAKEISPCSHPETVIRRNHVSPFLSKEWMTSVVFLADVYQFRS